MKLQNQVCTLEQAKRLNQLGIIQGLSMFFWDDYEGKGQFMMNETPEDGYMPDQTNTCFSAFSVAELGVMLPVNVGLPGKGVGSWDWYEDDAIRYSETEAQARAELLALLLEKGDITAETVNQRLLNA